MPTSLLHTEEITPLLRKEEKIVLQPGCPLNPPSKDACTTHGHQQQKAFTASFEMQPAPLWG